MKNTRRIHHILSLGLLIAWQPVTAQTTLQNLGATQTITTTPGGVSIKPSLTTGANTGYSTSQMFLRSVQNPLVSPVKDSTLQLENLVGNIDIILPRRSAPPSPVISTPVNAGIFSISKRVDSGGTALGSVSPILQISTSTSTADVLTLQADFKVLDPVSGLSRMIVDSGGIVAGAISADEVSVGEVRADELYLVNPAGGGLLPVASVNNGVVTFPQNAAFPATGSLALPGNVRFPSWSTIGSPYAGAFLFDGGYGNAVTAYRAVALGGQRNLATGDGAVAIGGHNYAGYENVAAGMGSTVIGSGASRAAGHYSAIVGSTGVQMLGTNAHYNSVLGGAGHLFEATSGSYNAIVGGASHRFESGGHATFLGGGQENVVRNGGWRLAMLGGYLNTAENINNAVLVGGMHNKVRLSVSSGLENLSTVIGGAYNEVLDSRFSAILGGDNNQVTGFSSAVVAAQGARATGSNQVVLGRFNTADTGKAFIIGKGSSDTSRSNALTVDFSGNVVATGGVSAASVTAAGAVQAGSATVTGQVQAGQVQAGSVTTNSLIITPYASDTSDISMGSYATP